MMGNLDDLSVFDLGAILESVARGKGGEFVLAGPVPFDIHDLRLFSSGADVPNGQVGFGVMG